MKTNRAHPLSALLLCCLTVLLLAVTASAASIVSSGTCGADGDNLTWTLNSDGLLTIRGSGEMRDFDWPNRSPWYESSDVLTIAIEDGITSVGNSAFGYCQKLTAVTLPDSVTKVGDNAFDSCYSLASINLPSSITTIGEYAFHDCSSLASIDLPSSLTSISSATFYRCSRLTDIVIPDGVTSIGNYAFYGCSNLVNITIPASIASIGNSAFAYSDSMENVYLSDIAAWCRISFKNDGSTPMLHAKNVFLNGQKIVSVTVPEGVTTLQYTFYGFHDLIRVTLPSTLTSIGDQAFYNCTSLSSISIPEGVTRIGYCAFSTCISLTSATLPDSLTEIGEQAFYSCSKLSGISFPADLSFIGNNAFDSCRSLTSIVIPDGVTVISNAAFSRCSKLADITLPDGITSIGSSAFSACSSLTYITLPSSLSSLGNSAFESCYNLTGVTIPDGVTSIGVRTFSYCDALTSVHLPRSINSIESRAFAACTKLTQVHITDVAAWCAISFTDNASNPLYYSADLYLNGAKLSALEIPANVQVISQYAFINAASIEEVALPKELVGVSANAFSGCKGIKRVYYAGSESEWGELAISSGNEPLTGAEIFYDSTLDNYFCRITVAVSDGGRLSVSTNAAHVGDIVTVTAAPYAGYELTAICVDGEALEGDSFVVSGNHTVSAVFTLIPVTGGTPDYRLSGISVTSASGDKLQELAKDTLLVSISVEHTQSGEGATVMLAQYDAAGRYQGLVWLTVDELPVGAKLTVTLPVDNRDGKIASLKAFVVSSVLSPAPVGNAVSFGDV